MSIEFTRDYQMFNTKKEGVYPITESDWERLKELIKNIIPEKKIYSIIYSIFIGTFISAIFSLFSLSTIDGLSNWIIPTNWAILIGSLILALAIMILDNQQKTIIKISTGFVISEMENLEKNFIKESDIGKT